MELFLFINLCLTIYLLVKTSTINQKLEKMGGANSFTTQAPIVSAHAAATLSTTDQSISTTTQATSIQTNSSSDYSLSKLFQWLKQDWMLKLGGFFMLLAAGWFVTFAFMNNWIGEMGRIVLGIMAGSGFMTWGTLRMKKVIRQGEVILVVGATILVTSIFSGQHAFNLYPETVSLAAMTFVSIAISIIAFQNKRETLAIFGILMIGVAPILAGYKSTTPNIPGLLTYLLCMILGVVWLSKMTGWRSITFLVTIIVSLYFAPYCLNYYDYSVSTRAIGYNYYSTTQHMEVDLDVLRFFAIIFAIIFNMSAFFTLLFDNKKSKYDFPMVSIAATFIGFCLLTLSTPDTLALKLAVIAMIFMGMALTLMKLTKYSYFVELYATVSILFLAAATLKASHTDFLPLAFSIEAIVITLFYKYTFNRPYPVASIILYGASYILSLAGVFEVGRSGMVTVGYAASIISTYFPYTLSLLGEETDDQAKRSSAKNISLVAGNILSIFGFHNLVQNLGQYIYATNSVINGVRYAVYAVVGSFLYFASRAPGNHKLKSFFGIGFIVFVVAALLLFEIWMMDIAARIVIFFLIGLLFISSIYFLKMYEKKS